MILYQTKHSFPRQPIHLATQTQRPHIKLQTNKTHNKNEYINTQNQTITVNSKPAYFGMSGFMNGSRTRPTVFDGTHSLEQKKWIGGNRDASTVSWKNRVNATGNGTLNATNKSTSFTSKADVNTQRNAFHRARSGGSIAPAKKTHNYPGAPIFY